MLRRRPIARMAVRTTAVVGTAAVVGGHMANKQAVAAQEQAPTPEAPAAAPTGAAPDLEKLKELAALRDQGVHPARLNGGITFCLLPAKSVSDLERVTGIEPA